MDRAAGKGENNSYPALLWHIKQIELDKRLHLVPAHRASWSYVSRTNKMGGRCSQESARRKALTR
jgi:hypothetical protein